MATDTLGEFLRKYRKRANVTQKSTGFALDVSRQLVTLWESDKSTPDARQLREMLDLYSVPVCEWADALKACEA